MEEKGFIESHNTEMNGFTNSEKSKEYGTMFRFRLTPKGDYEDINKLSVDPIRKRYLTASDEVNILLSFVYLTKNLFIFNKKFLKNFLYIY